MRSHQLPRSDQETRRGREQGRDVLENLEISLNVADVLRVIPEDERHQHHRRRVCMCAYSSGCGCASISICSCPTSHAATDVASLCVPPIPSFAVISASASSPPTLTLCPAIVAAACGSSRPRPRMGAPQGDAAVSRRQSFEAVLAVQQVCVLAIHDRGKPHVADPRVPLHRLQHQLQLCKGVDERPVVLRNQGVRRRHLLEPSLRPSAGEATARSPACQRAAPPAPAACGRGTTGQCVQVCGGRAGMQRLRAGRGNGGTLTACAKPTCSGQRTTR